MKWFKSSYSGSEGGACLEVAYDWRKSSKSDAAVHIRDSKNPGGPVLTVEPAAWDAFVKGRVR
ncbi:DUF397 domain-containing protein [Streptomyces luteolus]|uniref:DUF397 domain-containing protein n=1 Tax=Streptomyces luteolus TaxID=3043615 RepID=A0ABT6T7Y4_9ACTN|nr:DUF397 domain-containing protein [Streptomyces sp. B-S-A12]MDI3423099.1 DUF397 domain-containing protein [Streptomyces sp. B-S-A12]